MQKRISKFKKIILSSFFGILLANNQSFAIDCNTASVVRVGPVAETSSNDRVIVYLKNQTGSSVGTWGADTVRSFYLHSAIENKGIATLLTAFIAKNNVWVRIADTDAKTLSSITTVYIK